MPIVPARQRQPATRSQRVSRRDLFLTREEMADIAAATSTGRDQLLVRALAETGARLGEMLKLTPARLGQGYVVLPIEKRCQYEEKAVYLSPHSTLLHELMRYAIEHGLGRDDRFWPITRQHAHTIVTAAAAAAGVCVPAETRTARRRPARGAHAGLAPPVPPWRRHGHARGF